MRQARAALLGPVGPGPWATPRGEGDGSALSRARPPPTVCPGRGRAAGHPRPPHRGCRPALAGGATCCPLRTLVTTRRAGRLQIGANWLLRGCAPRAAPLSGCRRYAARGGHNAPGSPALAPHPLRDRLVHAGVHDDWGSVRRVAVGPRRAWARRGAPARGRGNGPGRRPRPVRPALEVDVAGLVLQKRAQGAPGVLTRPRQGGLGGTAVGPQDPP
jgi:hypothetical protein